jgi:hypothetical protein
MKLFQEIHQQRLRFLRKGLTPNRVLVPIALRHQFLGEVVDEYRMSLLDPDSLYVMGLAVHYSSRLKHIEVSLHLE